MYLPKDELFQRAAELLGVDSSYMEKHLVDLAMDRKIVQKEQGDQILIYPAQYYYLELNTARMLRELDVFCPEDEKIVERRIVQIEKETGTVLDEMQKKACRKLPGMACLFSPAVPVPEKQRQSMRSSDILRRRCRDQAGGSNRKGSEAYDRGYRL